MNSNDSHQLRLLMKGLKMQIYVLSIPTAFRILLWPSGPQTAGKGSLHVLLANHNIPFL